MKKGNNRGFTLIELLAVLAVLSVVMTITIYISLNVITKSKEKSYDVTINNIEKAAGSYLNENSGKLFFVSNDKEEYQCIRVQDLIDMGYFKTDITSSKISSDETVQTTDYIYLSRDKDTKVLTSSRYVRSGAEEKGCDYASNATADISIGVSPSGWAKSKTVTINYRVRNTFDTSGYTYNYQYTGESLQENVPSSTNFTVTKNGTVTANILDSKGKEVKNKILEITKIDNEGPVVSASHSGNNTVKSSVKIPITISDAGIGVDESSVSVDDFHVFVKTSDGDIEITAISGGDLTPSKKLTHKSGDDYELVINNNILNGQVEIRIYKNTILDKLGNPNEEITLNDKNGLNLSFDNTYKIKYHANGGTGEMTDTTCTYNQNCATKANTFTRSGYTFLGWANASGLTTVKYSNLEQFNPYDKLYDLDLYAVWKANTYTIDYDLNGGLYGSSHPTSGTYDKVITIDNPTKTVTIRGNANGTGANIGGATSQVQTFTGWTAINLSTTTAMHGTATNAVTNSWSNGTTKVTSTYFKNLRSTAGTVMLGANWASSTIKLPTVEKTGYTCTWNTKSDGTGTSYNSGDIYYVNTDTSANISLYAVCTANEYKIVYYLNEGSAGTYVPQEAKYDEVIQISNPTRSTTVSFNTNSSGATISSTASKTGNYKFLGWTSSSGLEPSTAKYGSSSSALSNSWSSGSTKVTDTYFKNLAITGTVYLTANWQNSTITLPTITKSGYTCKWNTASDGSGTGYNSGASYALTNGSRTLYAVCEVAKYTIKYSCPSGSSNCPSSATVTHGNSYTVSSTQPSLSEYTFVKMWNTKSDGSGTSYKSGATISNVTSDITLYASFAKVTLSFSCGNPKFDTISDFSWDWSWNYSWHTMKSSDMKSYSDNATLYVYSTNCALKTSQGASANCRNSSDWAKSNDYYINAFCYQNNSSASSSYWSGCYHTINARVGFYINGVWVYSNTDYCTYYPYK